MASVGLTAQKHYQMRTYRVWNYHDLYLIYFCVFAYKVFNFIRLQFNNVTSSAVAVKPHFYFT